MATAKFLKARLFLEVGKKKRVIALFRIEGWIRFGFRRTSGRQIRIPTGIENYECTNLRIEQVIENGQRVTYYKILYLGPVLRSPVKDLTLSNDFTFTFDVPGVDPNPVAGPAIPADDFDPCDYS